MNDEDKELLKIEKDLDKEIFEKSKSFLGDATIKEYPAGNFLSWPIIAGHEGEIDLIEVPLKAIENIYVKNSGDETRTLHTYVVHSTGKIAVKLISGRIEYCLVNRYMIDIQLHKMRDLWLNNRSDLNNISKQEDGIVMNVETLIKYSEINLNEEEKKFLLRLKNVEVNVSTFGIEILPKDFPKDHMMMVCYNDGFGYKPITLLHSHQLYLHTLSEYFDYEIVLLPYDNSKKINITN